MVTIFKGLQLDIGAPPQFMDFRYTVHDPRHGEFQLDHCGALMDVEPMGPDYVKGMCHDIEDPTFDATAIASNPKAQVRPIHRPPRSTEDMAADRSPHCAWTVIIDDSYPEAQGIPALAVNERSRAATLELAPIDPGDEGASDYSGPLLSATSTSPPSPTPRSSGSPTRSASRCTCSTGRFTLALEKRCETEEQLTRIRRQQLTGAAGVGGAPDRPRARHQPATRRARVGCSRSTRCSTRRRTSTPTSMHGGASSYDARRPTRTQPGSRSAAPEWTDALARDRAGARPASRRRSRRRRTTTRGALTVVRRDEPAPEAQEVAVTKFSTGIDFAFQPRRSLPITPV